MTLTIPANDHGQIRVFAIKAPPSADVIEKTPRGLDTLFTATLNPDFVDVVRIKDLGKMRLSSYISQGYDMSPDLVDRAAVDAITGYAILVLSRASGDVETTLTLAEGLRHVTTYSPGAQIVAPQKLPDASAQGILDTPPAKPPKSDARISGMIATYALLAMFALVGLMIWVGG